MKICDQCQTENEDSGKGCKNCGKVFEIEPLESIEQGDEEDFFKNLETQIEKTLPIF